MNYLPGQIIHADAWKYFREATAGQVQTVVEFEAAWTWFLKGWLARIHERESAIVKAWEKR